MRPRKDLTGRTFGYLTVTGPYRVVQYGSENRNRTEWFCQCIAPKADGICGKQVWRGIDALIQGQSDSCGCLRIERTLAKIDRAHKAAGEANRTHGHSINHRPSRLYNVWNHMKQRCYNPAVPTFGYYGGRGITVCPEWHRFEPFRDWALANGYAEGLTLDRINNDGNYCPENCRFITQAEQTRNTSRNVEIKPGHTVSHFAAKYNVPYDLVWHATRFSQLHPEAWKSFLSCLK